MSTNYNKLELSGILREKLDPDTADNILKYIDGLEYTKEKFVEIEPIVFRLDQRIDQTEGELKLFRNRHDAEPDEEKKLMLHEQITRYTTRMSMLKKIRNGIKSEH